MQTYSYKILEVDQLNHTMVVEFSPNDESLTVITLNMRVPESLDNLDEYINSRSPQREWANQSSVNYDINSLIGKSNTIDATIVSDSNVVNSQYDIMTIEHNAFLAEQSNTSGN